MGIWWVKSGWLFSAFCQKENCDQSSCSFFGRVGDKISAIRPRSSVPESQIVSARKCSQLMSRQMQAESCPSLAKLVPWVGDFSRYYILGHLLLQLDVSCMIEQHLFWDDKKCLATTAVTLAAEISKFNTLPPKLLPLCRVVACGHPLPHSRFLHKESQSVQLPVLWLCPTLNALCWSRWLWRLCSQGLLMFGSRQVGKVPLWLFFFLRRALPTAWCGHVHGNIVPAVTP